MSQPDPMLVSLLKATVEAGASDLHLTVGRPPTARRDGHLVPFENVAVLTAEDSQRMVLSLLDDTSSSILSTGAQTVFSIGSGSLIMVRMVMKTLSPG